MRCFSCLWNFDVYPMQFGTVGCLFLLSLDEVGTSSDILRQEHQGLLSPATKFILSRSQERGMNFPLKARWKLVDIVFTNAWSVLLHAQELQLLPKHFLGRF